MNVHFKIYNKRILDFLKELGSIDFTDMIVFERPLLALHIFPDEINNFVYSYTQYTRIIDANTSYLEVEVVFNTQSDATYFKLRYS